MPSAPHRPAFPQREAGELTLSDRHFVDGATNLARPDRGQVEIEADEPVHPLRLKIQLLEELAFQCCQLRLALVDGPSEQAARASRQVDG